MAVLPGRLGSLQARDVMTKDVITLSDSHSVAEAIAKLKQSHITGAPVVNAGGKFVGILSISDLVHPGGSSSPETGSAPVALAHGEDLTTWDLFEKAPPLDREFGVEQVGQHMSRKVASVTESAPLVEVARVMCNGHWHRVPVVDQNGTLAGIISTMDVLAALVNTADEAS